MKIRLTVPLASATGSYNAGDEYECSKDEAARFVEAGMGVAIAKKAERTTKKTPKKEKRG